MFSLQSKQQEVAGCCSWSQILHTGKPSSSSCFCGMVSSTSNSAKFFGSPATPAGTETSFLHVGQLMAFSLTNLSRQSEQKLCPQLRRRGQRVWSSKRSQQIEHSNTSDAILPKINYNKVRIFIRCTTQNEVRVVMDRPIYSL